MRNALKPTRRRVVVSGLAVAGGCFVGLNTQFLLSLAKAAGKPLLTQKNLTKLMRSKSRAKVYAELANYHGSDLVGFLGRYFALTDAQIGEIRTIPADQVVALKRNAKRAAEKVAALKAEAEKLETETEKLEEEAKDSGSFNKVIAQRSSRKQRLNLSTRFDGKSLMVKVSAAAK